MTSFDLSAVRGIIFDYGGTIDTRGDHWYHIIARGWRHAGMDVDDATLRHCYVEAERELARNRHILPCDNFYDLLLKKMQLEFGYLDRPVDPAVPAAVARFCYDYAKECIEEARPVLAALSEQFPMVLVSNFYGNVDTVLRDFDLRQYFQGIIESAVVGVRKPDARIFSLGVTALGMEPGEVLVVGDSLRKDILPARSIGCQTAWIKGLGWTPDEDAATDPALISGLSALV